MNATENLTIGWLGCVTELKHIAEAFEELKTEGLKVTKTMNEVVNWVLNDPKLLDLVNTPDQKRKGKAQWRAVACLVSDRFETAPQNKQRLVHPCYIIDFQFKLP